MMRDSSGPGILATVWAVGSKRVGCRGDEGVIKPDTPASENDL
jgi:hypothetical protein